MEIVKVRKRQVITKFEAFNCDFLANTWGLIKIGS